MNKKKLLALLMALVMTLTLVPVTAFAEGEVAEIVNGGQYTTLQAAIDNAQDGDTVKLLADINLGDAVLNIDKQLTVTSDGDSSFGITSTIAAGNAAVLLTGNGDVTFDRVNITSTKGHGIQAGKADGAFSGKLTFKNGTITVAQRGIRVYEKSEGFGISVENATIQSNINNPKSNYTTGDDSMGLSLGSTGSTGYTVSIIDSIIQGFSYCINVPTSGENLNVTMTRGETYGRAALNVWGGHNRFTLNNVVVHGLNNQTGPTEGFACIVDNLKDYSVPGYPVLGNNNNEYVLDGCTFKAKLSSAAYGTAGSSATEYLIDLRGPDSIALFKGNTTYVAYVGDQVIDLPNSKFGLIANESCVGKNIVILDDSAKQSLYDALNALSTGIKQITYPENNEYTQLVINEGAYDVGYYYYNDNSELTLDGLWENMSDLMVANSNSSNHYFCNNEFLKLNRNVTINDAYTFDMRSGHTSFGLEFGEYSISLGENGSLTIPAGVSINTDVEVDIFSAPEDYKVVETNNGDGTFTYSVAQVTSVARIGSTEYDTLEAAFAAAVDGDTINVLADCAGNGIKAPQGKFGTNGLTVNFNGHTYTVDGDTVGSTGTETNGFQLLKDNKITFMNGTITSAKAKILVQNYSNLTLEGMTLTLNNPNYTGAYTLSNNNGNVVIDGTTITANPAGGVAFDVCRYSSYPSVSVTVQGNSVINGNIEFDAGNGNPIDGIHLTLAGGTHTGEIKLTNGGKTALDAGTNASITKASTFTQAAPEGYAWAAGANDVETLVKLPDVAQIGSKKYTSLQAAVTAAAAGDTVELLKNIELTATVEITKNLNINLNGWSIASTDARALWVKSGNVNITGSGTISANGNGLDEASSVIRVGDSVANTNAASLTVGENVTVSSGRCYGITAFGVNDTDSDKTTADITLTVNGTVSVTGSQAAISGNGTSTLSATTMTINGSVSAAQDYAIYHPGKGTLTVNGTVTGAGGIEAKGGIVNITGGTVSATGGEPTSHNENNNGTSTANYALAAVENKNYQGEANFTISGGAIKGTVAVVKDNTAKWHPSISITGGKFTSEPDAAYVADGYEAVSITGEAPYTYQVGKVKATSLSEKETESSTGAVTYQASKSVVDTQNGNTVLSNAATVTVKVTPTKSEDETTEKAAASLDNIKNMTDFVATVTSKTGDASEVNVTVQLAKGAGDTSETGKIVYEVHPEAIISVSDSEPTTVALTNEQIQGEFTFKLNVSALNAEQVTVVHKHADGTSENMGTFVVDSDKNITLTVSSFSEFDISAAQTETDDGEYFKFEGASLRRRVLKSEKTKVVSSSTDIRFGYVLKNFNADKTYYFQWSTNGTTWSDAIEVTKTGTVNGGNYNGYTEASLVITNVPYTNFGTTIYTRIYAVDGTGTHVLEGDGKSVNNAIDGLMALTASEANNPWIDYAKFLHGGYYSSYTLTYEGNTISSYTAN